MTVLSDSGPLPNPAKVRALQQRIGWLCHLGRLLAVAYALWTLWLTISFWLDGGMAGRRFAMIAGVPFTEVSGSVRFAGFSLSFVTWLIVAATCLTAWKLFSSYLQGRIFTAGAAGLLRQTTLFGIGAVLLDMLIRPIMVWLVAGTVPSYAKASYYYFSPHDLALLIFLISLFAIAHIFKVAAELADENAEIL